MKVDLKKLNEMFTQKEALQQALLALNKQQEEKIANVMNEMFVELGDELKKYNFLLCVQTHYKYIRFSIFTNLSKENEQSFNIDNLKIIDIKGERDETFNKVIKLTGEFLEELP